MNDFPTIETDRLRLRAFQLEEAVRVQQLAGDRDIAAMTERIPHPYEDGMADSWIATHDELFRTGKECNWAITLRQDDALIGAIGLVMFPSDDRGELGYWVGKPYWNRGYCSEAARAVVAYGFATLGLNRIQAICLVRNLASRRVLAKVGMQREGILRQYIKKWECLEDVEMWAMLKGEYAKGNEIFLKTLYPSRKYTRLFKKGENP